MLEEVAYNNEKIHEYHIGFRPETNTTNNLKDAITCSKRTIEKTKHQKQKSILLFIDLVKVYDTIDRNILL
jgi:hypothetical protein